MHRPDSFQRWAAVAAILSAPLAIGSLLATLPAIDYDFSTLSDPLRILRRGAAAAGWLRASMALDLFGYYLLIAPLVLVLQAWLQRRGPTWARLFAGCLLAYLVLGAAGAAVLGAATPRLLLAHAASSGDQRLAVEAVYSTLFDAVYGGVWNVLEVLLAGVGWLGFGWLLRPERPVLGVVTMVLGVACLLDAAGHLIGSRTLADPGLYIYLLLAPAWALALGVSIARRPVPQAGDGNGKHPGLTRPA